MAYAQINYSQKLGTGGYTIAEAGCFLTAFCNLLARFGENIDPPTLNNYFLQHGKYLHDPSEGAGTVDNLAWGSVSAYDGQVATVGVGGAGWPPTNDAIVKFIYKSRRSGLTVTHFCLVADHNAGTIVDSWDGVTKVSPYGAPVAWAAYERHAVQVVTPPPPQETPAFTIENIPEKVEELKIDTHLWNLNQRSWPGIVNNPVGTANAGAKFSTHQIAHHILGGSYYLPDGSADQGYNVVDCEDPAPEPAPAPAPAPTPPPAPTSYSQNTIEGINFQTIDGAPKQMWISKVGGAEKWNFKDVSTWRGFKSVEHLDYGTEIFISGVAHHPIPPKGADYYMTGDDFGDFKKTGQPANFYGFNWADITDKRPPALPEPAPAPAPPVKETAPATPAAPPPQSSVTTDPAASTTPIDWQSTYRPFPKSVRYIATHNLIVKDLSGKEPDMPLPEYNPDVTPEQGVVQAYGRVTFGGVDYYRLKTNNDPGFNFWYCVPIVDPVTRAANLLVYPTEPASPISKTNTARDILELGATKLESGAIQFFDDIIPKWLKNKK